MSRIEGRTARVVTVAGMLAAAIGIVVARAGGMPMPPVPPGLVLLVVGAVLVGVLRRRSWPAYVAAVVALAEVVPSAMSLLGGLDGAVQVIGSAVRLLGALTALVGAVALATRRPGRSRMTASAGAMVPDAATEPE